jgi:enoyl-[acyl-carrier protein] reductase II
MKLWLDAGIKVIPVVPSITFAKLAVRNGAAAVIAEGGESGGHIGELTTMALVPQVVDTVDIPVIAAGGIADGRGVAAAFALGADAVQIGTRFLSAKECNIHQNYKNKVFKAGDTATIVTGRRLGHPVRSIRNQFAREYSKIEYTDISDEELDAFAAGRLRQAVVDGDEKNGCFLAGQIAALVKEEQTCQEIIEDLMSDTQRVLDKLADLSK